MTPLDILRARIAERPWRAGLYAFVAVTLVTVMLVVIDYALRPASFPVRSVSIEGEYTQVREADLVAAVTGSVRGNFFLLDLDAIRQRAEAVAWVHTATVRRVWPDGVHIGFTEQRLAARWGREAWLNDQGEVVDLRGRSGPADLPQLTGPASQSARMLDHLRQLQKLLDPAGVSISRLTLSPRHSWTVELTGGLQLVLGRESPEPKIERFAHVYRNIFENKDARAARVDLRYTNGFTVRWTHRANAVRDSEVLATGFNEG